MYLDISSYISQSDGSLAIALACAVDTVSPCAGGWYKMEELWKRALLSFLKEQKFNISWIISILLRFYLSIALSRSCFRC